ncbi:SPASM domain-containing protein, partial [bacterium]|nr:SPASM domain-containing protein [bacterium]
SKVQAGLVEYVKRRLPKNGNFFVTWYGGEPLLEKKILFSLSAIFKEICKQKKTRYEARIITNGTLLTEETVKLLKEENVVNAQITLDGIPDKHNKRRPFKSHEGSFDIILRHMKTASLHLHVIVRINMDKSNLETAKELLHLLDKEGVLPRIFPYLGRVQPYSDVCRHVMPDCLDITDFSKIELEFDLEKCFLTRDLRHAIIIERKSNYCMADGNQGYVVSPEGYLFKCYNEVGSGSENAVGSVLHKQTKEMKRNLRQWRTWSPFSSPECISCRFLPVCFGGCPWQNRQMKEKPNRACISWRYTVEERMRLHHALSTIASLEKND